MATRRSSYLAGCPEFKSLAVAARKLQKVANASRLQCADGFAHLDRAIALLSNDPDFEECAGSADLVPLLVRRPSLQRVEQSQKSLSSAACLAAHDPAIAAVKCKGRLLRFGTVSDFDVGVLDRPVVPPPPLQCFADQQVQTITSSPQPKCFVVVEPLCPLLDAQASTIALLCGRLDALLAHEVMAFSGSRSLWNVDAKMFVPSGGNGVVGVGALQSDAPHIPRHRLCFIGMGDLARVSSASKFSYHVCSRELNNISGSDVEDVTPTRPLGGVPHDCNQQ